MTGGGHLPQRSQPANLGPTVFQPPVSQLVCDGCIPPGVECGSIVIAPVWLLATLQPLRSLLFDAFGDVHPSASSPAASCVGLDCRATPPSTKSTSVRMPRAVCCSIALTLTPSRSAVSFCDRPWILRNSMTWRQRGGQVSRQTGRAAGRERVCQYV